MLLKWSIKDPVSQREIDRNNAVYNFQGNRNPFIDHPEFIEQIWKSTLSTDEKIAQNNLDIDPNPVKNNILFVNGKEIQKIKRIEIYNISGALVQVVENPFSKGNNIQLRNLNKGVYILKAENTTQKFILE